MVGNVNGRCMATGESCEVLPVGTQVWLGAAKDVPGVIQAITIRSQGFVTYSVTWWVGGENRAADFQAFELTVDEGQETARIGFLG